MSNLTFSFVKTTLTRNGHEITQATGLYVWCYISNNLPQQDDEQCPRLFTCIQNHLEATQEHRKEMCVNRKLLDVTQEHNNRRCLRKNIIQ